jgi:uncharacterized protein YjbI with pentapeptide repeats
MKHQIKHRYTNDVLFECELPDSTPSGVATRHALEKAVSAGANLDGASLYMANLAGASLARANLDGASLARASLDGANLTGASLDGASLDGANLAGASLSGKKLIGNRPIFMIGPIGSRCSYFTSYITDAGIMLRAGCFFGPIDEFKSKLIEEHGENDHRKEYEAALTLIECHHQIWK